MKQSVVGTGCLILFALPFAGGGLFGLSLLVAAIRRGDPARQILLLAAVAVPFCLVGFGLIVGAVFGGKKVREDETLRAQHPDSPWLWNPEWASRRIGDDSRTTLWGAWAFAILWNSIAAPSLLFVPHELEKGNIAILLALLFPLVGLFLLTAALRATLRALRFRRSTLVLDTLPAPLGGALRGRVEVPYPALRDASPIVVRLTQTVTTKSGKSTTTSVQWQEEVEVPPSSISQSPDGVTIPVDIDIPGDASPTDESDSGNKREWRLTVDAELPGIDYSTSFSVPVFRTAFSDVRAPRTLHTPPAEPRNSPNCRVTHTAQGLEIHFPAFRARSAAIVTLCIGLLSAGIAYVMVRGGLPLVFPIVLGLFTFFVLWTSFDLFFGSTTIVITHDAVTIRKRSLFSSKEKRVSRDDIASVELKIETQQSGGRVQPWYGIRIHPTTGRRIKVVRYIRSKRDAEWVAAQIRRR
ncbi:MAG TPA: hypothetical protein VEK57_17365 [Thermoanaerobaculia bacterium]|nr:hypothetical protein [Thermoanaerobaculia bacterium]